MRLPRQPGPPASSVEAALYDFARVHPYGTERRLIMAVIGLELNLDDTGTDPNGPAVGAGGYLSTAEGWAALVPAWVEALPADLKTEGFHFTKWVRAVQRGSRDPNEIKPLLAAITTHFGAEPSRGVGRVMRWADYGMRSHAEREALGDPFNLCLVLSVEGVLEHINFMAG